jgi:hypothetical protein
MPESQVLLNPNRKYSKAELLKFAEAEYWDRMAAHSRGEIATAPSAREVAIKYLVKPRTLQDHVQNPMRRSIPEYSTTRQWLTPAEEQALEERLILMDDWNCPASKAEALELGQLIWEKNRQPTDPEELGDDWFLGFLKRHPCFKFVYVNCKDRLRCNAEDWNVWDDYFAKVRSECKPLLIAPAKRSAAEECALQTGDQAPEHLEYG